MKVFILACSLVVVAICQVTAEPLTSKRLLLAQCGTPSNCWGFSGGTVIVAPNATDAASCHNAIKKCNNNVEINTNFSGMATIQDCSKTIKICNLAF
jgi:hypothetical protein